MDLSYQEKSILGSLLAMAVVYSVYFAGTLRDIGHGDFGASSLGRLIFTVIAIVVIEIVYHIVLALEGGVERKDERDILIESKAYRNAYLMLATGASLVITYFIVAGLAGATRIPLTPFLAVNLVLLFMVIAELTKSLTQLFYYRRGV
jgi:hypothetical protein